MNLARKQLPTQDGVGPRHWHDEGLANPSASRRIELPAPSIGPRENRFDDARCYLFRQFAAGAQAPRTNSAPAMSGSTSANLATGGKPKPAAAERWGVAIPSVNQSLAMMLLPTVLSLVAGSCDIITFIGLGGLFTAHITGNLVVLIARVVAGEHASISYILSVPVFIAALAATALLAAMLGRAGVASLCPLLTLQLLLLFGSLFVCIAGDAPIDPSGGNALIAGMLAVSAMAVQNAIVQVSVAGMPSTAVMTTNISHFVADLVTLLSEPNRDLAANAAARTKHTAPAIVGFAVGCGLGAGCEIMVGLWALALPTALAFLALVIGLASKLQERSR
jgi:uncharacterized membrane protein YoaK (UPF0700 family)